MPFAIYVLGLGIFTMVTSEFLVAGLMPQLSEDLGAGIPQIGFLVSVYAAAMAIGGPLLTAGLLRLRQKTALICLYAVFLAGQALGALADGYALMVVARLVTGAASGAFFGVALAICVRVTGPEVRGRATSIVLGGLMVGTVLGLPLSQLAGEHYGWRFAFWAVAALAALALAVTLGAVPALPKEESDGSDGSGGSVRAELGAFRNARLWAAFATSMLIIGATFAAFSYFVPILTDVTGFAAGTVPLLLVVYGAATVIGNAVVGRLADRYTLTVLGTGLALNTVFLTVFALGAGNAAVALAAMTGIGLVGVTMNPAMVTRVMRTANDRPLVNTVHTSFITLGVVVGSWVGGIGVSHWGLRAPLWTGAAMAVLGLLTLAPELLRRTAVPAAEPSSTPSERPSHV
ncbi:MFS transporter [Streptomyces sp. SP17BM10]|uniref:MFS transporter n=1 Tax=Streptomyces sp. SP17BM10 TaxID=3002530 RepID=UPI002E797D26|nr:MFS transporter [Streptomyces sp. SP17BM10]MEE1788801.1 MFS transporter [Streptomyces sp. SP17BM10]